MLKRFRLDPAARWRLTGLAAGGVTVALLLLAAQALPRSVSQTWRERALDALLAAAAPLRPSPAPLVAAPIVIVDIDRASVAALGPWPWRRRLVAQLIAAIARAKPRAIGIDILFEGPETRSPAALARRLAAETKRDDLARLAESLPDDDADLAAALALAPVALGYALDPDAAAPPPDAAFSLQGPIEAGALWRAKGARAPEPVLADAATGFGAAPLPGDADGIVRRAPALALIGDAIRPGLALETLRLALAEPVYGLAAAPQGFALSLGTRKLTLPADGMTRLAPVAAARADIDTRSAGEVLSGAALPEGALVLIGASIPEAGALRASPADPLVASTRLQAAALADLRDGRPALPALALERATPALMAGLIVAALAAGLALPPAASVAALGLAIAALWALALAAATQGLLWSPLWPALAVACAGLPPTLVAAAAAYRRERLIRRRFEQHLAPAVVRRIAANPAALRLSGERREATALFTDLEGFTELTTRVKPAVVVWLLDGYFEGVVRIVHGRGGMIDKFVGDAVHAFFNMPLDQKDHVEQALACAGEIAAWSESYRRRDDVLPHRLGRTRIGVECGPVIAGEVGAGEKLDYTAYGEAVNLAARLEAANNQLGTQICVGPAAAARAPAGWLRPTGRLALKGLQGEIETFGPWPESADETWRQAYLKAWVNDDRAAFAGLAMQSGDAAARRLAGGRDDHDGR